MNEYFALRHLRVSREIEDDFGQWGDEEFKNEFVIIVQDMVSEWEQSEYESQDSNYKVNIEKVWDFVTLDQLLALKDTIIKLEKTIKTEVYKNIDQNLTEGES